MHLKVVKSQKPGACKGSGNLVIKPNLPSTNVGVPEQWEHDSPFNWLTKGIGYRRESTNTGWVGSLIHATSERMLIHHSILSAKKSWPNKNGF